MRTSYLLVIFVNGLWVGRAPKVLPEHMSTGAAWMLTAAVAVAVFGLIGYHTVKS